jgi:uncharacterized membrane protein
MTLDALTAAIALALDTVAVAIVALGVAMAFLSICVDLLAGRRVTFNAVRLDIARYLALALEFLLAADLVETTSAPTWSDLGKLAAIATIRTALNYSLAREMREERALARRARAPEVQRGS